MIENQIVLSPPLRFQPPPISRAGLRHWWQGDGGYRDVLRFAFPLFLSNGSSSILQLFDRLFLTWYSPTGMAAAAAAGMLAFTMQALFLGLVSYAATFVAQYYGANRPREALIIVWQALYIAIIASLLVLLLLPAGSYIFAAFGHDPAIRPFETQYFRIFILGSFAFLGSAALQAYFIGRGDTKLVMWINFGAITVHIVLDYLLIFGKYGFPELGVAGAAWASVAAQTITLIISMVLFLHMQRGQDSAGAWRPNIHLALRLLRFGSANGLQFMLDMVSWTVFLLLIGRLSMTVLGATNIAFQLNGIAFFPIFGFSMAAATLVGQNLGKNRVDLADRAVWSAMHCGLYFTGFFALLFLFFPGLLIAPFAAKSNPAEFEEMRNISMILLRFVAAYCMFDVLNLILAGALKGAGDTFYVMLIASGSCLFIMLIPTYFLCIPPGGLGIYGAWSFMTLTVMVMAVTFLWRYLKGHWRNMRVIEHEVID